MLIDVTLAFLIFISCVKGYRKGLIVAVFSLFAFIAGMAAALKLSAVVAGLLSAHLNVTAKWLPFISFLIVFIGVVFLVNLGSRAIQKSVEMIMLGWVNRIAGMLLYVFIYCIIFSILLFYAIQLNLIKETAILQAQSYPYIQPLGPAVINRLGTIVPFFKDMFLQLQAFFEAVSNNLVH